jgi:hypothetical protein
MRNLLFVALLAPVLALAQTCFPGADKASSPDGTYSVEWQAPTDGQTHHLVVKRNKHSTRAEPLLDFIRSACIVWEPNGSRFALVLNSDSTTASTRIYAITDLSRTTEVFGLFPSATQTRLRNYGHFYIRALDWTAAGLQIQITGHEDDENGRPLNESILCKPKQIGFACDA